MTENELHESFTLETGQDAIDQHNEYNSNYVDWLQKLYLESQTPNAFTKETERITTHLEGMRKLAKSEQVAEPVEEQSGDFKKEYLEYQDEMDGDCKSYESWLEGELRATIFQCNHAMNLLSENPLPIYQKTEDDLRTKFTHYCMATDEITDSEIEILAYKYADTLTNDSIQGIIIGENVLKAFTWLRSELERRKGGD